MHLLIPGRHHLVTRFQFDYLRSLLGGLSAPEGLDGSTVAWDGRIDSIIFAVTSSNHSNTRRNPVPFYLRAMMLSGLIEQLGAPGYIYGIDDLGVTPDFASYTVKRIRHESDGMLDLTPENTLVICSTPVLEMYRQLGFGILPAELATTRDWSYRAPLPWGLVEEMAKSGSGSLDDPAITGAVQETALHIWRQYRLADRVQMLFRDKMISGDGDLTETRDYNVYVRQMDEIAEMKFDDTAAFIQPGRIGDIGCAVGSWIRMAAGRDSLRESDFYGIEVSRFLFEICQQRKLNQEFRNPFVFFAQKNAVTGLVYAPSSMNTIHTSSLTHEIESYGGRQDLLHFIGNRFAELVPGGVWINRDVVAPPNKDETVVLWLDQKDGNNDDPLREISDKHEFSLYLRSLSTMARFIRFARDFRRQEGYRLSYETLDADHVRLRMSDATEFLSRKDYTDNWESEMHETFCYWTFNEWKEQLRAAGFGIHPASREFRNEWIAENRWRGHVELCRETGGAREKLDFPVTTMILVAVRN